MRIALLKLGFSLHTKLLSVYQAGLTDSIHEPPTPWPRGSQSLGKVQSTTPAGQTFVSGCFARLIPLVRRAEKKWMSEFSLSETSSHQPCSIQWRKPLCSSLPSEHPSISGELLSGAGRFGGVRRWTANSSTTAFSGTLMPRRSQTVEFERWRGAFGPRRFGLISDLLS